MKDNNPKEVRSMWMNIVVEAKEAENYPITAATKEEQHFQKEENESISHYNELLPDLGYLENGERHRRISVPAELTFFAHDMVKVNISKASKKILFNIIGFNNDFIPFPYLYDGFSTQFITGYVNESHESELIKDSEGYTYGFFFSEEPKYFVPETYKSYVKELDKER